MSNYSGARRQNPTADQGKSVTVKGWTVTTHKLPILMSGEIDTMNRQLGIAPPEMIFGNNSVEVSHESGWTIKFTALDALSLVDKTAESMLKVSYSDSWQRMRERVHENIKEIVKPFDWTYTTNYKGSINIANSQVGYIPPLFSLFSTWLVPCFWVSVWPGRVHRWSCEVGQVRGVQRVYDTT